MNNNNNITEPDIKNIDVLSQLEHQIQIQETKESGWIFDKIYSLQIILCKTGELNGSNHDKSPLRSNANLNLENIDKCCSLGSILAYFHPCENSHSSRVRNYI